MSDKPVRVGDRVRIDGGRWDDNIGTVERIVGPDEEVFAGPAKGFALSDFTSESMALVRFKTPLRMVDGDLDSVGVPTRRLKPL